jgi:hypothetical protein
MAISFNESIDFSISPFGTVSQTITGRWSYPANQDTTGTPMPYCWLNYAGTWAVTSISPTVTDSGGYCLIDLGYGFSFTERNKINKGDRVRFFLATGVTPNKYYNILSCNNDNPCVIKADFLYSDYIAGNAMTGCYIYLQTARNILPPKLVVSGEPDYFPLVSGVQGVQVGSGTDWSQYFCFLLDAGGYAESIIKLPEPANDLSALCKIVTFKAGLSNSTYSDLTLGPAPVLRALELSPYSYTSGVGGKISHWIINSIIDGTPYFIKWNFPDSTFCWGARFEQLFSSDTGYQGIQVSDDPFAIGTEIELCVGTSQFWLCWQSRYGGYETFCFNYNQKESNVTKSLGSYRQGYFVRDLGKQASTVYELSSGIRPNLIKDWFIDLQNSPKVWFSRGPAVFMADILDLSGMDWTECTIEDSAFAYKSALSDLMEFNCRITTAELNKTYRG